MFAHLRCCLALFKLFLFFGLQIAPTPVDVVRLRVKLLLNEAQFSLQGKTSTFGSLVSCAFNLKLSFVLSRIFALHNGVQLLLDKTLFFFRYHQFLLEALNGGAVLLLLYNLFVVGLSQGV